MPTKKRATKKKTPTKKTCKGDCKKNVLPVEMPDRASYSMGIKVQVANYEPVDVSHSYSASAEPGETPEQLNLRVAKQALKNFGGVFADALSKLKTLKDEAFEDMLE